MRTGGKEEMTGKVNEGGSSKGVTDKKLKYCSTQEKSDAVKVGKARSSIKRKGDIASSVEKVLQGEGTFEGGVTPKQSARFGRKSVPFSGDKNRDTEVNKGRHVSEDNEMAVPSARIGADDGTNSVGEDRQDVQQEEMSVGSGGEDKISGAESSSSSTGTNNGGSDIDGESNGSARKENVVGPGPSQNLKTNTGFVVLASVASTLIMCGSILLMNSAYPQIGEQVLKWFPQLAGQMVNLFPQLSDQVLNLFN